MKNWIVVHAGMIAFNELLILLQNCKSEENDDDIEFIISRLFSDERIQLLSNLPKTAFKHNYQYMKTCVDLTHTVLKTLEQYATEDRALIIEGKSRRKKNTGITKEDVERLVKEEGLDRDEAIDILTPHFTEIEVSFNKVQRSYINEPTIETYVSLLERFRELEPEYIKKIITFFHRVFIQAKEESLLFKIDIMILLRDMLAPDGIDRTSRVRKHVQRFVDYYLQRLKKRLSSSPAWFVGLLFPSLHDSQVGYFQKYGENRISKKDSFYGVPPSIFKNIEDQDALPASVLKDLKYGILISTLIDSDKTDLLEKLISHLKHTQDVFSSWLTINVNAEKETENPPNEIFSIDESTGGKPLLLDRDFRALLKLIGYQIPQNHLEPCYLPGTVEIDDINESIALVSKYMSTPFETPNGQPSASYLIRPRTLDGHSHNHDEQDGWTANDDYDYNDPSIIRDEDMADDDAYFKELENGNSKITSERVSKGVARSKKKSHAKMEQRKRKRQRNTLAKHDIDDEDGDEQLTKTKASLS